MFLTFECTCGLRVEDVMVGATMTQHYAVLMCRQCQTIFSKLVSGDDYAGRSPNCQKCGKRLTSIKDRGTWVPAYLQEKYPEYEPWTIDADPVPEPTEEDLHQAENAQILCPRCGLHSMHYKTMGFWD